MEFLFLFLLHRTLIVLDQGMFADAGSLTFDSLSQSAVNSKIKRPHHVMLI